MAPGAPRTIIVTGASRGIGAVTARRLARGGANLVLAARSEPDLGDVAEEITRDGGRALVVPTDTADLDQLAALVGHAVDEFGGIDVLVNNAGVLPPAHRSVEIDVEEWERVLRLNLTSPWRLANLCHPWMRAAGGGVVVNVTSSAGFYPSVGLAPYNASKAALAMLTKGLALEWAGDGVRVVGVAPGKIDTALIQPIVAFTERRGLRLNPIGRLGAADEVAALIEFVVSDDAGFMTGTVITLDGGEVAATGADAAR
ncbi:MAG: SDR family NAD(P)-dependent oxidoreductase [Microbacteriaceae bacterium]